MSDDVTGSVPDDGSVSSDAFQVLGSETRLAVLQELLAAESSDDGRRSFSALFEATDEDTTAGFAYHLRQLTGRYVRKGDEEDGAAERRTGGYRLTYAGRKVARAVAAGTYTESVDREPTEVPDPCPLCGETALVACGTDNHLAVGCEACDRTVLRLPFPPGGHGDHEDLLAAFDRQHRYRIAQMTDGSCPECGGRATATVRPVEDSRGADDDGQSASHDAPGTGGVRARLDCDTCGYRLRVPVTLAVRDHPAVVSLYHDHGVDVRERPLWNVGPEWRETVLSRDPLAVRVSTRVDGTVLSLYVAGDLSVVHVERTHGDDAGIDGPVGTDGESGATDESVESDPTPA